MTRGLWCFFVVVVVVVVLLMSLTLSLSLWRPQESVLAETRSNIMESTLISLSSSETLVAHLES